MYQLPHLLDRPGQLEAFKWLQMSQKKYNIICAPTGSGKSAWPAEMSKDYRVIVLTQTKSLQAENYAGIYLFDPLYGRSNYPCKAGGEIAIKQRWSAFDCQSSKECDCPYQLQERLCLASDRASLNYHKFLMSQSFMQVSKPDYLFLDEAHNLPDIVSDFIGLYLKWDNEFIKMKGRPSRSMRLTYLEAMSHFRRCYVAIQRNKPNKEKDLVSWRRWERLNQKVNIVAEVIDGSELSDWYFEADQEGLTIKPLTAKYHFKHLFNAPKVVLMSATIKPSIIDRLGIDESECAFYELPNIWPVPTRLIYDLNAPAINYQSSESDKDEQAQLIISVLVPDKSGVIHVSSKRQAYDLKNRLNQLRTNRNISFWIPSKDKGTDGKLQEWYATRRPGLYCISYSFREGVDLGDDDIGIMGKTPYPGLGSNYEKAKMEFDQAWYYEITAYFMQQWFGRFLRGVPDHYKPGRKLAYIADSSWHRVKDYLSSDFLKRIRSNGNGG